MIALGAAQIAQIVGGTLASNPAGNAAVVTGSVVIDSRLVEPGAMFVAIEGENVDGHDFAAAAARAGAAVILAARPLPECEDLAAVVVVADVVAALGHLASWVLAKLRATGNLQVAAITGSAGKTTTKDLVSQLLAPDFATIAPQASFNNSLGLPLTVLRADSDTRWLVLEMGTNAPGEIAHLAGIAPPDIGVVLTVGSAHIGQLGGLEGVARAKAELVHAVPPGGTVVLNYDDTHVRAMAGETSNEVRWFSQSELDLGDDTLRAENIALTDHVQANFDLVFRGQRAEVSLQLVGRHQVSNALAAASVAILAGISVAEVAQRLSEAQPLSGGRMAVFERGDGVTVIDDSYNANPESMRAALTTLTTLGGNRRTWAVLGEMLELGTVSQAEHASIGAHAVQVGVSHLVAVGDGAQAIAAGALAAGASPDSVHTVATVSVAGEFLAGQLRADDVVLVKSSHGAGLWQLGAQLGAQAPGAGGQP